ncbi:hypothetical protein LCGC14_1814550 [marine sediment metagenome]|uniref:Uncharacterized protein n=1 Tax=marine sediment metagenome TaxID=412755 RepID=A0A0F9GKL7_9ZZZZ
MTTYTADAGVISAVYTADSDPANQPIDIMLIKYGDVWHFDVDDNPEPTQAGLKLTSGFYHVDPGPEVPRGLTMTVVNGIISLST